MVTLHPTTFPLSEWSEWETELHDEPGPHWAVRVGEDPNVVNLYVYEVAPGSPSSRDRSEATFSAFLWLEPHSQLSAWIVMNV
jgi:hypothetical protein